MYLNKIDTKIFVKISQFIINVWNSYLRWDRISSECQSIPVDPSSAIYNKKNTSETFPPSSQV